MKLCEIIAVQDQWLNTDYDATTTQDVKKCEETEHVTSKHHAVSGECACLCLHMARNGLYTTDLNTSKQVGVKGKGTNGTNLSKNRYKQGPYHNIVNKSTQVHKYCALITTRLY
jgi:hypothetical protein